MALYASLDECKSELKTGTAVNATEDPKLLSHLRTVSARIDRQFQSRRRFFEPFIESRQVVVSNGGINSLQGTLALDSNLLAATGVNVGSTALTVGSQVEAWPTLMSPARTLRLLDSSLSWSNYCGAGGYAPSIVTIAGVWGFHRDYTNAWLKVDDVTLAQITVSATTFTVASAAGVDAYNRTPRLSPGNLLKVDNEYMELVAVSSNTLTVIRGANGSTAATHEIGADVLVWQVEDPIKRACARQAAFLYARRGAYESSNISDLGIVNYPSDLLAELREIVAEYAYE